MTRGARLRLASIPDAMAAARGAGLGVLVDGGGGFAQAFTTPFGPCVRAYGAGEGLAYLVRVLRESARGSSHDCVVVACARAADAARLAEALALPGPAVADGDPASMRAALAAFGRRAAEIPSHAGPGGTRLARTTTVVPCPGVTYEHGTRLRADARETASGAVVRWLDEGGAEVGVHLVLDRRLDGAERDLVASVRGRVVASTPGAMPAPGGTRPIQTLVLDVPHAFAEAFADGRMPRHGGVTPPRSQR